METVAKNISSYLSTSAEILAALVIGIALFKFLYAYIQTFFHPKQAHTNAQLRVKFGSSLTLALEILLAADILITAVAPSWDDIGKLAAIAAIRTALNYFLEKELAASEARELRIEKPQNMQA